MNIKKRRCRRFFLWHPEDTFGERLFNCQLPLYWLPKISEDGIQDTISQFQKGESTRWAIRSSFYMLCGAEQTEDGVALFFAFFTPLTKKRKTLRKNEQRSQGRPEETFLITAVMSFVWWWYRLPQQLLSDILIRTSCLVCGSHSFLGNLCLDNR